MNVIGIFDPTHADDLAEAWSLNRTVEHIRARAGSQFDPSCVEAFDKALLAIASFMSADAVGGSAASSDAGAEITPHRKRA